MEKRLWKFLEKLLNKKLPNLFTIVRINEGLLDLFYLPRDPSNEISRGDQFKSFLKNELFHEIIFLPLSHERSPRLETELEELKNENLADDDENNDVTIISTSWTMKSKPEELVLFGCEPRITELKKKFLQTIERNLLITYKLLPIKQSFVSSLFVYFSP